MSRSNLNSPAALLLVAIGLAMSGCNSGVAAIVGASQGSSGNAAGVVSSFQVLDARDTPAQLQFNAVDQEGDSLELQFVYRLPGGVMTPMTALVTGSNPGSFTTSANGVTHSVLWDFASEPGFDPSGLNAGIEVLARRPGTAPVLVEGGNGATSDFGNDPPAVDSIGVPGSTVAGIALIELVLRDSSSELIDISIEYDVEGDVPDAGWRYARPAGATTTPTLSMTNVLADAAGTTASFFWDTSVDLASASASVRLRATPSDATETGATMTSGVLGINNNTAPFVFLDTIALLENTDRSQGYTLKYTALDEEGDRVLPVVQWRRSTESFPALPSDPNALREVLADPEQRRSLQIVEETVGEIDVDVLAVDENHVRFPREIEQLGPLGDDGANGLELEVLRPAGEPQDVGAGWPAGTVTRPACFAPAGDVGFGWVLDEPTPFAWRLQRIELATGDATQVAQGAGSPLGLEPFHGDALIASVDGSGWTLTTVELATGTVLASGSGAGTMRGLDAVHARMAVATVDDAVVRIGLPQHGVEVTPILSGLNEPWGLALDPYTSLRAWIAERGADRILELDLETHVFHKLPAASRDLDAALPSPRHLELSHDRRSLLVVCEDPFGAGSVRQRSLGRSRIGPSGVEGAFVDLLFESSPEGHVATGPSGLIALSEPGVGLLRLAGGVEQVTRVGPSDPSGLMWTLDAPLSPVPAGPRMGRLLVVDRGVDATPEGQGGQLAWNLDATGVLGEVFVRIAGLDQAGRGLWFDPGFSIELNGATPLLVRELPVGGTPTTADLDGDGDLDLVGVNVNDTQVALQTSPGEFELAAASIPFAGPALEYIGIFLTAITLEPDGQLAVVPADMDRDGRLDLVAASGAGSIQIAFQEPGGGFGAPVPFGTDLQSSGTVRVHVMDVEGDGELEVAALVVREATGGFPLFAHDVHLFRRTGSRSWAGAVILASIETPGLGPPSIDSYDVDGDGVLDLRLAGTRFFRRVGPLEYVDASDGVMPNVLAPLSSEVPASAVRLDLNEDGALDLGVQYPGLIGIFGAAPPQSGKVFLFERGAGRSFTWSGDQINLFENQISLNLDRMRAIDLDGDRRPEIVGVNPDAEDPNGILSDTGAILVARRPEPGEPWSLDTLDAPVAHDGAHTLEPDAIVDLDGDGFVELLEMTDGGTVSAIGLGAPPGVALEADPWEQGGMFSGLWAVESLVVRDVDGDGALDLVFGDTTRVVSSSGGGPGGVPLGSKWIYRQIGPRKFEAATSTESPSEYPYQVALADFDDDGDEELVSLEFSNSSSSGTGNGRLSIREIETLQFFGLTVSGGGGTAPDAIDVADLNLDGIPDIAAVTRFALEGVGLEVILGVAGAPPQRIFVGGGISETFPTMNLSVADVNGDGLPDVIGSNVLEAPSSDPSLARPLAVWLQDASGGFQPEIIDSLVGASVANITAADIDGDGACDLVYSEVSGADGLVIALQTSPGVFKAQRFELGPVPSRPPLDGPTVVDLDGDGLRDIVPTCHGEKIVVVRQYAPGLFEISERLAPPSNVVEQEVKGSVVVDLDGDGALDVIRLGNGFSEFNFVYPFAVHWGGE